MKESSTSHSLEPAQVSSFWQTIQANVRQHRTVTITAASRDQPIPLSFAQMRLWQLYQIDPHNYANHVPAIVRLQGELNRVALEQSLRELTLRHEILRTKFPTIAGQPVQVIGSEEEFQLDEIDLRHLAEPERAIAVDQWIRKVQEEPFDLAIGPLWRVKLLHLADDEFLLIRCMHHLIYDGWSGSIFKRELKLLYVAFSTGQASPLPPLPIQYADYAVWQRHTLTEQALSPLRQYWRHQLSAPIAPLELPSDRARSSITTRVSAKQQLMLSPELTQALKFLSQQEGVSLFVTLLSAFKTLLFGYHQQTDLLVCAPFANRQQLNLKKLIGYFNSVLPLRTDLSGNPTWRTMLQRVSQVTLEAQAHSDLPLQAIAQFPSMARIPLSRVLFALQNVPAQPFELLGLVNEPIVYEQPAADFDLSVSFQEQNGRLVGTFTYNSTLFEGTTIAILLSNFQKLLEHGVEDPDQCLIDLTSDIRTERDRSTLSSLNTVPIWLLSDLEKWLFGSQNVIQERIAQLWSKVLGLPHSEAGQVPLNIFANFFELGGHSLAAAQLIQNLEEEFQVQLSLQQLLENPTILELAECVSSQEHSSQQGSPFLVPMQTNGSLTPLFFIPPGDGSERALAINAHRLRLLGKDQPVYGLCTQKTNGEGWLQTGFHASVDAIAGDYVKAIRAVQPQGPYLIMGDCIASQIALEVAQQLIAQNQTVARLIILDFNLSWGKTRPTHTPTPTEISAAIAATQPLAHQEWGEFYEMVQAHYRAILATYQPQPYAGAITLIATETTTSEDPTLGWAAVAQGGIEVCIVPGDHNSYMSQFLHTTIAQIRACLLEIHMAIAANQPLTLSATPTFRALESVQVPKLDQAAAQTAWSNCPSEERLEKLYQRALEMQPERVDLHLKRGYLAKQQGNWDLAIACAEQVLALDPNHSEAYQLLNNARSLREGQDMPWFKTLKLRCKKVLHRIWSVH